MRLAQDKLCAPGGESENQHPCVLGWFQEKAQSQGDAPLTVTLEAGRNLEVHRFCCQQPVPPSLPLALQFP